jgi:hypothetical protein
MEYTPPQEFPLFRQPNAPKRVEATVTDDLLLQKIPQTLVRIVTETGIDRSVLADFLRSPQPHIADNAIASLITFIIAKHCRGYSYLINTPYRTEDPTRRGEPDIHDSYQLKGEKVEVWEPNFPHPCKFYEILNRCFAEIDPPPKLRLIQDMIPLKDHQNHQRCSSCRLKYPRELLYVVCYHSDCDQWRAYFLNCSLGVCPRGRVFCPTCVDRMGHMTPGARLKMLQIQEVPRSSPEPAVAIDSARDIPDAVSADIEPNLTDPADIVLSDEEFEALVNKFFQ